VLLRQRATDRPIESSRFSASAISGCNVSFGARPDSVADSQPPCKTGKYVRDAGLRINYDYLILATGTNHSYFGHDEFAAFALGLKSLADAEALRNHILEVLEKA
jgi:hypothetical protein